MTDRSQHLADRVEARRVELGYTISALAEATGLTQQALKNVRNGERRRYQDRLTLPLTAALRWSSDSIDRLLAGEEPIDLGAPAPAASASIEERLDRLEAKIGMIIDVVAENRDNLLTLLETVRLLSRERREDAEAARRSVAGE